MITVIHEDRCSELPAAVPDPHSLWLDRAEIAQATGWDWKPEGLCKDDTCLPVPPARAEALVRGDRLDLAGMWRHLGQPLAANPGGEHWVLGTDAAQRGQALASLHAPDFALPDLDGRMHRLSDHRGRKVFLATWASW
ncbi:MAG: hypothetical protein KGQ67_07810 [Betaproteobacteria bacterium]|nr:hypothetical protein [Betaproteobacteria bacterium]